MMTNKKKMVLALTAVLVLSVAVGSFAATRSSFSFSGSCKKNFLTSGSILKTSSETWSLYHIYLTEIPEAYDYAYARPETSDGETCGTRFPIYPDDDDGTSYLPNSRGTTTNEIHARVYNPLYVDNSDSSTSIRIKGWMDGVN